MDGADWSAGDVVGRVVGVRTGASIADDVTSFFVVTFAARWARRLLASHLPTTAVLVTVAASAAACAVEYAVGTHAAAVRASAARAGGRAGLVVEYHTAVASTLRLFAATMVGVVVATLVEPVVEVAVPATAVGYVASLPWAVLFAVAATRVLLRALLAGPAAV